MAARRRSRQNGRSSSRPMARNAPPTGRTGRQRRNYITPEQRSAVTLARQYGSASSASPVAGITGLLKPHYSPDATLVTGDAREIGPAACRLIARAALALAQGHGEIIANDEAFVFALTLPRKGRNA
ncbi:nucleocapsid protein [Wobbly possum disease virus]|uniref:Nucleocapsid protein n=1 Tax=Wobbly possum disease virus TaxID=1118369 RepID=G9FGS5_9NIDO|nr:nucleocapsid protein [Wobbly possum disease virus]AEU12355.1 nucleocapsid protein [Wobbly possum disease virus]